MFDKQKKEQKAKQQHLTSTFKKYLKEEGLCADEARFTFEKHWHAQLLSVALSKVHGEVAVEWHGASEANITDAIPLLRQVSLLLNAMKDLSKQVLPSWRTIGQYWVYSADTIDVTTAKLCTAYRETKQEIFKLRSTAGNHVTKEPEPTIYNIAQKVEAAMSESLLDPTKAAAKYPEAEVLREPPSIFNSLSRRLQSFAGSFVKSGTANDVRLTDCTDGNFSGTISNSASFAATGKSTDATYSQFTRESRGLT